MVLLATLRVLKSLLLTFPRATSGCLGRPESFSVDGKN